MNLLRKLGMLALAATLWMLQLGCGDQYRPVANPIVSPGGQPAVSHFAWVVNFNPNGAGTTTEIDTSGDTTLSVQTMGAGSIAEAFPPNSLALFVANRDNDTVSEYLPTVAGPITTVSLLSGSKPVFLTSALGGNMFVLNSGANSACPMSGSVSSIPLATLAVSNTQCVGSNPTMMAQSSANNAIYVVNGDGTVSVLGGNSGTITLQQGQSAAAVVASANGAYMFIVSQGVGGSPGALNIVDILNTTGLTVAASVPLGVGPTFAVIDPVLNRLYVANTGGNTVSVFDASNVNVMGMPPIPLLATVPVGTRPVGVAALPDSSRFYVANAGSDDVTVVSANSFSPLTTVPLPTGANPAFIAAEPSSTKVYVADQGTSQTTIIQTSNNAIATNIPAPQQDPLCTSSCALQQPMMIVTE
jgi:YVTN family beta-propeller protein